VVAKGNDWHLMVYAIDGRGRIKEGGGGGGMLWGENQGGRVKTLMGHLYAEARGGGGAVGLGWHEGWGRS
jgi:hypothetical protein